MGYDPLLQFRELKQVYWFKNLPSKTQYIKMKREIILIYILFACTLVSNAKNNELNINPFNFVGNPTVGNNVKASCFVFGNDETVQFEWLKNGSPITEDGSLKINHYSDVSVLAINHLKLSDSGNFTCLVSSRSGNVARHSSTLNVLAPPEWIRTSKDTSVFVGSNFTLECRVNGYPEPSISWSKTDNELAKYHALKGPIFGTNNRSLTIVNAKEGDSGFYRCFANNDVGEEITKTIAVTVWKVNPFKVQAVISPPSVIVGERVTSTCTATSSEENLVFKWFKDGQEIHSKLGIEIHSYTGVSMLILHSVSESDSGNITCLVSSKRTSKNYTTLLNVQAPPRWIRVTPDQKVTTGSNVTLECLSAGSPNPSIVWRKLSGEALSPRMKTQASVAHIWNVQKVDEGILECEANNGVGSRITRKIELLVYEITVALFNPPSVILGKHATTTCAYDGSDTSIHVKWFKDGVEVKQNKDNIQFPSYTGVSIIIIDPVREEDNGTYACEISGKRGTKKSYAPLLVKVPPRWIKIPKDLSIVYGSNITLDCAAIGSPTPVTQWIKISDTKLNEGRDKMTKMGNATLHLARVGKQQEGTYQCKSTNGVGVDLHQNIVLTVYGEIKIQPFSFPNVVSAGERALVSCTSMSRLTTQQKFAWYKDEIPLDSKNNIVINNNENVAMSTLIIDPVKETDDGNFTCVLRDRMEEGKHTAKLSVHVAPIWTAIPQDLEAIADSNISVKCHARGRPIPKITWKKVGEGKGIPQEQRDGVLRLVKADKNVGGQYECRAENGVGEALNKIVLISVLVRPVIQPFSFTDNLQQNDKASVTCLVKTGIQPLEFTWLKDGTQIHSTENREIRGYDDLSLLVIASVQRTDIGLYKCIVKNKEDSDSHSANLTVKIPPSWISQPKDKVATIGARVEVKCESEGYPSPSIKWSKKDSSGKYSVLDSKMKSLSGSYNMVLEEVGDSDEGYYRCQATNGIGQGIFTEFLLTVNGAPKLMPFMFTNNLKENEKARIMCVVNSGETPFSFKWLKDGKTLTREENIVIEDFKDYSSLAFSHLSMHSNGNYTCQVKNNIGTDQHTAQLVVNAPPKWVTKLKDLTLSAGNNASVLCEASGYPEPTIHWQKETNGGQPASVKENQLSIKNNAVKLIINSVSKADDASYTCIARNSWQTIKQNFHLQVTVPARFEEKFSIETVRRGDSATLKCKAKGDDPLTIAWTKDKQDVTRDSRYEQFESSEKDGLNSELFIRNVERQDGALYSCQAKNNYGSDERNIKVVVVEVPAQILDARVQEVWSRSVSISWSGPYSGNSPITKYIIQYWRDKAAPHKLHEHDVSASQTTATISKSLKPGVSYALTIIAENEVGQGEPSKEVQFVTGEEEPSGPPTDVWAMAKGSTTMEVQWKAPPKDEWNGEIKGYYIGFKIDRSSQTYSYKTVEGSGNETMTHILTDLVKATRYNIVVKAFNSAGTGPPSQDLLIKTLEGELPPPPAVSVIAASSDSISVKWGHNEAPHEKVTGYTLHLQKDSGEWMHIPMIISEQNRYTLTGLESGTNYKVYVTANNQFGRGHPSETLIIKTAITGMQLKLPFNVDLGVIIPAVTGTIAVLVVIIVVIIYIRKVKSRRKFEKSIEAAKNGPTYSTGTNQRYIDIDKARPMLPPGVMPIQDGMITPGSTYAAYASIPSRDATIDSRVYGTGRHEMKTFQEDLKPGQDYNDYYGARNERPPTYPRANSKKSNPYDPKQ